ncbi:MAG: TonB-dependent receptor domain-containing protein [Parasphingopyxis sp.]|nr:TonB-dependent receptor [Sphingomonadales bacterium]
MLKPLAKLLVLSTALYGVPAAAQDASTATPPSGEEVGEPPAEEDDQVDISAPGAAGEPIIVQGRFIPEPVRSNSQVISVLSNEDIARTGDGDIAGALERVTGLSVDEGGFVYVRGLGDRYSQAFINGLPLPSPDPLKRVVPLDIFPTSLLSSVVVQKSYSVEYPGEFGGGLINLTTAAVPDESFLTIGGGIGYNSETTGQQGYIHGGSDSDWTGFDSGLRDIPNGLAQAFNSGSPLNVGDVYSERNLQDFAASLVNASTSLVFRQDQIPVDYSIDISGGYNTLIGDSEFGLIANLGFSNSWFTRDSIEQQGTRATIADDARTVRTENNVVVSGLLGAGFEFGEHAIRLTGLYLRDTLKQTQLSGADNINTGEIDPTTPPGEMRQRTNWIERQLFDAVAVGEFEFGDISADLRAGYANSQREAPYEREFVYFLDPIAGDYVNNLRTNPQKANIAFSDLNEDVWSGALDLAWSPPTGINLVLSGGYAYQNTSRDAFRRDFSFVPISGLPFPVIQERPDYLLSDFNIYGGFTPDNPNDGIVLQENNTNTGSQAYDAGLEIHGVYAKLQAEPFAYFQVEAGVRYEDATQEVVALDLFGAGNLVQTPPLNNAYFLPAATITWNFIEDVQLRLSASKTIARPQFRELARPEYLDPDSGRLFFGNPFLQDSELLNFEGRLEWYFARGEHVSIAGFYKRIDNPIEPVAFIPAGTSAFRTTFANAPRATLYGAEIELVKYLPLDGLGGDFWADKRLFGIANYTYSRSELSVGGGDTTILNDGLGIRPAGQVFIDGAALTGQSEHLANLQFGIEDTSRLSQLTVLLNYASDRVTTRGPITGGALDPDLVEQPGLTLDIVYRQGFEIMGREFELKAEARNITGEEYRETQTGEVTIVNQLYERGTTLALSLAAKF